MLRKIRPQKGLVVIKPSGVSYAGVTIDRHYLRKHGKDADYGQALMYIFRIFSHLLNRFEL